MTKSPLRISIATLVFGGAALVAGAAAANLISNRYDGAYWGAAKISPALSNASCAALPLVRLEIRNGILRAYEENGRQIVKGFVTADGFFTSDYIFSDRRTTLFEGIVDAQGRLTGGIFDGACVWIVKLSKERRGQSA